MISNEILSLNTPPPGLYLIRSEFEKPKKGLKFAAPTDLDKKTENVIAKIMRKGVPGPGSYSPETVNSPKSVQHSFSLDKKLFFKDQLPNLSPNKYCVENFLQRSNFNQHTGFSFGSCSKTIDVRKVFSKQ
jgi:hypothetical protein